MEYLTGYDFKGLNGNADELIVDCNCDKITNSLISKSLFSAGEFVRLQSHKWSYFSVLDHSKIYYDYSMLAQRVSEECSERAIYFFFHEESEWMGYELYEDGEKTEEYSYGFNHDKEMVGIGLKAVEYTPKDGTVVAVNNEYQFRFRSKLRSITEDDICTGEEFIAEFLHSHNAYIGWALGNSEFNEKRLKSQERYFFPKKKKKKEKKPLLKLKI
jgi:hypothetical protein